MEMTSALAGFAALSQETRLAVWRLLVRHEPEGLAAGAIAANLGVANNTLSAHLAVLMRAGLARSRRDGRRIIYRADLEVMRELVDYLVRDCCAGSSAAGAMSLDCSPDAGYGP